MASHHRSKSTGNLPRTPTKEYISYDGIVRRSAMKTGGGRDYSQPVELKSGVRFSLPDGSRSMPRSLSNSSNHRRSHSVDTLMYRSGSHTSLVSTSNLQDALQDVVSSSPSKNVTVWPDSDKYPIPIPATLDLPPYLSPEKKNLKRQSLVFDGERYTGHMHKQENRVSFAADEVFSLPSYNGSVCSELDDEQYTEGNGMFTQSELNAHRDLESSGVYARAMDSAQPGVYARAMDTSPQPHPTIVIPDLDEMELPETPTHARRYSDGQGRVLVGDKVLHESELVGNKGPQHMSEEPFHIHTASSNGLGIRSSRLPTHTHTHSRSKSMFDVYSPVQSMMDQSLLPPRPVRAIEFEPSRSQQRVGSQESSNSTQSADSQGSTDSQGSADSQGSYTSSQSMQSSLSYVDSITESLDTSRKEEDEWEDTEDEFATAKSSKKLANMIRRRRIQPHRGAAVVVELRDDAPRENHQMSRDTTTAECGTVRSLASLATGSLKVGDKIAPSSQTESLVSTKSPNASTYKFPLNPRSNSTASSCSNSSFNVTKPIDNVNDVRPSFQRSIAAKRASWAGEKTIRTTITPFQTKRDNLARQSSIMTAGTESSMEWTSKYDNLFYVDDDSSMQSLVSICSEEPESCQTSASEKAQERAIPVPETHSQLYDPPKLAPVETSVSISPLSIGSTTKPKFSCGSETLGRTDSLSRPKFSRGSETLGRTDSLLRPKLQNRARDEELYVSDTSLEELELRPLSTYHSFRTPVAPEPQLDIQVPRGGESGASESSAADSFFSKHSQGTSVTSYATASDQKVLTSAVLEAPFVGHVATQEFKTVFEKLDGAIREIIVLDDEPELGQVAAEKQSIVPVATEKQKEVVAIEKPSQVVATKKPTSPNRRFSSYSRTQERDQLMKMCEDVAQDAKSVIQLLTRVPSDTRNLRTRSQYIEPVSKPQQTRPMSQYEPSFEQPRQQPRWNSPRDSAILSKSKLGHHRDTGTSRTTYQGADLYKPQPKVPAHGDRVPQYAATQIPKPVTNTEPTKPASSPLKHRAQSSLSMLSISSELTANANDSGYLDYQNTSYDFHTFANRL